MKEFLEQNVVIFFGFIIFGGLLWGMTGLGLLHGKNWNIINRFFKSNPRLEGLVYSVIGLCTLLKSIYNMLWEKPNQAPHIIFIILIVVASGLYWGIIGIGLLFKVNLKPLKINPNLNTISVGIISYTVGIFAVIKLLNFIF